MTEYIFEINEALYNEETGEAVLKPKIKEKLIRCRECKHWVVGVVYDFCNRYSVRIPRRKDEYCSDAERKPL